MPGGVPDRLGPRLDVVDLGFGVSRGDGVDDLCVGEGVAVPMEVGLQIPGGFGGSRAGDERAAEFVEGFDGAAFNSIPVATAAARPIPSTPRGGPCRPGKTYSPTSRDRLTTLFAVDAHVEVEATWGIYQRMIAAYRHPDRRTGRTLMSALIESISQAVPAALTEVITLGRTLKKRANDVLAYFDRPGTSNGPTEAINGRLERLRGSALGFRNLTHYIARSQLEAGGFKPRLHPQS